MKLETFVYLYVTTISLIPCFIVGQGYTDQTQHWRRWQWYLKDTDVSMNVKAAWQAGYTGKGILVAVVDDGVRIDHPDLKPKINLTASYDFLENRPITIHHNPGSHGTSCAGIIAGEDNANCGVGVAFEAQISSIRIYSDRKRSTDKSQANGLSFKRNMIDVYSNSWGPGDMGFEVEGPGSKLKKVLENGTRLGRHGKGSIFVFAAGNGGVIGDSCAFSGYVNSIYTIAISGVNWDGSVPAYTEQCAGIMAVTYGQDMFTDGKVKPPMITAKGASDCTERFPGTSGTAAMASGIIALALQANPSLTWRDVQHLITRSSKPLNPPRSRRPTWTQNGAHLLVSSHFGFGLMDASKMIEYAKRWRSVPQQLSCEVQLNVSNVSSSRLIIPWRGDLRLTLSLSEDNCSIRYLEHVQVEATLYNPRRGYLEMSSLSPSKTKSKLLYSRDMDIWMGGTTFKDLRVTSLHYWGEKPIGEWKIIIWNARQPRSNLGGRLFDLKIIFFGTKQDPLERNTHVSKEIKNIETVNASRRRKDIPIHGGYSRWSYWGRCSRSCGGGIRYRYRYCNNPTPQNNGRNCSGTVRETEERRCNTRIKCPVDGGFSQWTTWSQCSATCGIGTQHRNRSCTDPSPANNGKPCNGTSYQTQRCNNSHTCLDPVISERNFQWSTWSECTKTCAGGTQYRFRFCNSSQSSNGRRNCSGLGGAYETRNCTMQSCTVCKDTSPELCQAWSKRCDYSAVADWCPLTCGKCKGVTVHGGYSEWSDWGPCNRTCGRGTQERSRLCSSPRPANRGRDCSGLGPSRQTKTCNTQSCEACTNIMSDEQCREWFKEKRCKEEVVAGYCVKTCRCQV